MYTYIAVWFWGARNRISDLIPVFFYVFTWMTSSTMKLHSSPSKILLAVGMKIKHITLFPRLFLDFDTSLPEQLLSFTRQIFQTFVFTIAIALCCTNSFFWNYLSVDLIALS